MHVTTINKKEVIDLQKSNEEYMGEFGYGKGRGRWYNYIKNLQT